MSKWDTTEMQYHHALEVKVKVKVMGVSRSRLGILSH